MISEQMLAGLRVPLKVCCRGVLKQVFVDRRVKTSAVFAQPWKPQGS